MAGDKCYRAKRPGVCNDKTGVRGSPKFRALSARSAVFLMVWKRLRKDWAQPKPQNGCPFLSWTILKHARNDVEPGLRPYPIVSPNWRCRSALNRQEVFWNSAQTG